MTELIGFVGLGNMGRPMAARLVGAGFTVRVFDVDTEAAQRFTEEHGGEAALSLAALASNTEVVITMLPDGAVVRAVVLGDGGALDDCLLRSMRPGSVLIDMSSSAPMGTQSLGKRVAEEGIALLDAPVSGGVPRAEQGTLSIMVGGDPPVRARCRKILEAMGTQIFETGVLGSGHAMKALNNLVSAAGLIAATEALLIGRRFGLDPSMMIDVLNASSGRNYSTENKFHQFVFSRRFDSGFSLDLMIKDLGTALDLADQTGTPAPLSTECRTLWARARSELDDHADHTAVVRWFEALARTSLGPLG